METIPKLTAVGYPGKALQDAVKAFAMAIASQKAPESTITADALVCHDAALGSIHAAIQRCRTTAPDELSAAIMFLFLSEILLPSASSSRVHVEGLAQLMGAKGPSYYSRGIPHALFTGFRPAIIVWFISNRKSAFLGSPDWCTIPFRETPPDPLQSLMTVGADIAAALETVNELGTSFNSIAMLNCLDLINRSMRSLDKWKDLHFKGTDSRETCTAEEPSIPTDDISYHDITEANTCAVTPPATALCPIPATSA
ncbi:hypothetical protein PWT90_09194 [Aphanocladium album]|nr:hypothetical protein PWT90_09194 [Aphanocladium album]